MREWTLTDPATVSALTDCVAALEDIELALHQGIPNETGVHTKPTGRRPPGDTRAIDAMAEARKKLREVRKVRDRLYSRMDSEEERRQAQRERDIRMGREIKGILRRAR